MTKSKINKIHIIIGLLFIVIGVLIVGYLGSKQMSFLDACWGHYPENRGNYPYITGSFSSGMVLNIPGKVVQAELNFRTPEYGTAFRVANFKLCNANNVCSTRTIYVYAQTYSNSKSMCLSDCSKYNWPLQCNQASKMPIAYTCDNICSFDTNAGFAFQQVPATPTYTVTSDIPEAYYTIWYNPNDKPWLCTPNWQTGAWTPAVCGASRTQTRTVTDANNCNVASGRPVDTQSCICVPNLQYSEWSKCQLGQQTRYVYDSNNCENTKTEVQSCTIIEPPTPPANLWTSILDTLRSWLHGLFPFIF